MVVKPPSGAAYSRNITFVEEYHAEDSALQSTNKTQGTRTENEEHGDKQATESSTETERT